MTKAAIKRARREAAELRRRKLDCDACALCGADDVVEVAGFDGWGPQELGLCDECVDGPELERVRLELWEASSWNDPFQRALLEEHRRRLLADGVQVEEVDTGGRT